MAEIDRRVPVGASDVDVVAELAHELQTRHQPIGLTVATVIAHQVASGLREDPDDTPEQHLRRATEALRSVGRAMVFVVGDAIVRAALEERGLISEDDPDVPDDLSAVLVHDVAEKALLSARRAGELEAAGE